MNIKSLRKSYENLTMLERLSLADNALARDDESELRAIVAASPRKSFSQVDYFDLMQEITKFRLCNLIVRLSYIMQFDYFWERSTLAVNSDKPNLKREERLLVDLKMSAYLYVRATDSWKILNDELGLRPNFDEEISEFLFSLEMMKDKEMLMREIAFTEDEAKEHLKAKTGSDKMQTIADEIEAIRKALELPTK
ncbi:MAG: hypothetical protein ACR2MB_16550 [Acidimicrobiales bacterium]